METITPTLLSVAIVLLALVCIGATKIIGMIKEVLMHQHAVRNYIHNTTKHKVLKDNYFNLEARAMQNFMEKFLGHEFYVQCNFMEKENLYRMWIWKRYEQREMGALIDGDGLCDLMDSFMHLYYSSEYFVNATAFPDKD